jgi:hypothetical protein
MRSTTSVPRAICGYEAPEYPANSDALGTLTGPRPSCLGRVLCYQGLGRHCT